MSRLDPFLARSYDLPPKLLEVAAEAHAAVRPRFEEVEERAAFNQGKVLEAFHAVGIREEHLTGTTGYGYHDAGREALERVWARVFRCEAALVRWQMVSGTQAIAAALLANCGRGEELVVVGEPYETLRPLFGEALGEQGVAVRFVGGGRSPQGVAESLSPTTRWLFLQRSRGYSEQESLSIRRIREIGSAARARIPGIRIVVDNCYGEFVENEEPTEAGADLAIGSLIKNPGGGLAPTGGYIVGREEAVRRAAERLSAPGLGGNVGPTLGINRSFLQGLFLAPHTVGEALKGMIFAAAFWERLAFRVFPHVGEPRTDLIQGIALGSKPHLLAFCRGIQRAGPVDSTATPEGWAMPGYRDEIVMAGGTFIQGGSLELSCDAPIRPPYAAYLQGGLTFFHARLGSLLAARELIRDKLLHL